MKVMVTGGAGLIGWSVGEHLVALGHDVTVGTHRTPRAPPQTQAVPFAIDDAPAMARTLRQVDPDAIVHLAGLTDVDACERDPTRAQRINGDATEHLLQSLRGTGTRFVYLSSSFVFGPGGPHEPSHATGPVNAYGRSKLAGERFVTSSDLPWTIVRTDQPYGWSQPGQHGTMVEWVVHALESGNRLTVFADWSNNPTLLSDVGRGAAQLLDQGSTGTFHLVGPDFVDRHTWARAIARTFDFPPALVDAGPSDPARCPARRPNAELSNRSFRDAVGWAPASIQDGLLTLKRARRVRPEIKP